MPKKQVFLYDTTLRDGSQGLGVSFSVADKIQIAHRLDSLGFHYVEGGWPGSNPKDIEFFKEIKNASLIQTKIAAFGSTRRAKTKVENDRNVSKLLEAETPVVTFFGKTWNLHVTDVLRVSLDENLKMIEDTASLLKKEKREVIYDAEHFFDGYKADPKYAIETLKAAKSGGADVLALCDTNGGTLPTELRKIFKEVKKALPRTQFGIHTHNDAGLAVANALVVVEEGGVQVQGTINGIGERTGNCDLCSVLPNLQVKLGYQIVRPQQLRSLTELSRFVDDLANLRHNPRIPYVGEAAFAHKGGIHVNAVQKNKTSYEHMDPDVVGGRRRILVSELSGQSNVLMKAKEYGIDLSKKDNRTKGILERLKEKERDGYEYESAEASFEVLMMKILGTHKHFFDLQSYRTIVEWRGEEMVTEATIKLDVDGKIMYLASEGDGPVNALDAALRKSLEPFFPILSEVELADFKVRVMEGQGGTAAKVRVLIESKDTTGIWCTVGVSENIIEACMEALVDSIEFKLLKAEKKGRI